MSLLEGRRIFYKEIPPDESWVELELDDAPGSAVIAEFRRAVNEYPKLQEPQRALGQVAVGIERTKPGIQSNAAFFGPAWLVDVAAAAGMTVVDGAEQYALSMRNAESSKLSTTPKPPDTSPKLSRRGKDGRWTSREVENLPPGPYL
jgi:hypothetical protein